MIGGKVVGGRVGEAGGVFVIAEVGVNHDGEVGRALELVDAAAEAGADAVKFQYFEAERLVSAAAGLAGYQSAAGEGDAAAMLDRLSLGLDGLALSLDRASERGLATLVSVFDAERVDAVASLGPDGLKGASPEVVNRPLLEAMSGTGLPLVVSTGASELGEVVRCADWLHGAYGRLWLMQCVSAYPVAREEAALDGMGALFRETGLGVGYSDHTAEVGTGAEAVRRGAVLLEKHLTWDRGAVGPDHAASLDAAGFAAYVRRARGAARGRYAMEGVKGVLACEREVRAKSRQSVVTRRAMRAGTEIGRGDVCVKRPGTGIEPWRLRAVLGSRLVRDVEADVPLAWGDVAVAACGGHAVAA